MKNKKRLTRSILHEALEINCQNIRKKAVRTKLIEPHPTKPSVLPIVKVEERKTNIARKGHYENLFFPLPLYRICRSFAALLAQERGPGTDDAPAQDDGRTQPDGRATATNTQIAVSSHEGANRAPGHGANITARSRRPVCREQTRQVEN